MFKINNRYIKGRFKNHSVLTINTAEGRGTCCSGVLLLTFKTLRILIECFYCFLWKCICFMERLSISRHWYVFWKITVLGIRKNVENISLNSRQNSWRKSVKKIIFNKVTDFLPVTSLKMNSFIRIFQRYYLDLRNICFSRPVLNMADYATTAIFLHNKSNNYDNKQIRNWNSYKDYWSQTSNINWNNIVWKSFNKLTTGKVTIKKHVIKHKTYCT